MIEVLAFIIRFFFFFQKWSVSDYHQHNTGYKFTLPRMTHPLSSSLYVGSGLMDEVEDWIAKGQISAFIDGVLRRAVITITGVVLYRAKTTLRLLLYPCNVVKLGKPRIILRHNWGQQSEYLCTSQLSGFKVMVHNQTERAFPDSEGFNMPPGRTISIALAMVQPLLSKVPTISPLCYCLE